MRPFKFHSTDQLLQFSKLLAEMVRVDMQRIGTHGVKISRVDDFRAWEAEQTDRFLHRGLTGLREIGKVVREDRMKITKHD